MKAYASLKLHTDGFCKWTDYFSSFIESDLAWRLPLFVQCVIGTILAVGSLLIPESPRYVTLVSSPLCGLLIIPEYRWLIDNGKDHEGKLVIADLHGGDLNDPIALSEYEEIKDKVREDVSNFSVFNIDHLRVLNDHVARRRRASDVRRNVAKI